MVENGLQFEGHLLSKAHMNILLTISLLHLLLHWSELILVPAVLWVLKNLPNVSNTTVAIFWPQRNWKERLHAWGELVYSTIITGDGLALLPGVGEFTSIARDAHLLRAHNLMGRKGNKGRKFIIRGIGCSSRNVCSLLQRLRTRSKDLRQQTGEAAERWEQNIETKNNSTSIHSIEV